MPRTTRNPWPLMSDKAQLQLLHLAAPLMRWPHPAVIKALAAANAEAPAATEWGLDLAKLDVDPMLYLWPGSACVYPGLRRKTGKGEVLTTPCKMQALALDRNNNYYPRQAWGKLTVCFDEIRNGYHLVHLFPHKQYDIDQLLRFLPADVSLTPPEQALVAAMRLHGLPGLFSHPANMCYLPAELARPTDAENSLFRRALWYHALTRHEGALSPLPGFLVPHIKKGLIERGIPDDIAWNETEFVGNPANISGLLTARKKNFNKWVGDWTAASA
jgi:hypothetical protein